MLFSPQLFRAIHAVSRSSRLVGTEAPNWINDNTSKARPLGMMNVIEKNQEYKI